MTAIYILLTRILSQVYVYGDNNFRVTYCVWYWPDVNTNHL